MSSSPPLTGDALVQDNQARAAALGINIPGVGGSISSAALNPAPAIQVPGYKPATETAALAGHVDNAYDNWVKQLSDTTSADKANTDDSLSALITAMEGNQGQNQLTNEAYSTGGVDKAQADLQDTTNQIAAEKRALENKVTALQTTNPQGMSSAGVQENIDNANTESLRRQADLAIIQTAKQGAYDSAKTIADRAVAAKYEAEQNNISNLQFIYTQNKDLFTTDEQRQFEATSAKQQSDLDEKKSKELADYDETIKQNDPQYQADLAHTKAETAALNQPAPGVPVVTGNPAIDAEIAKQNALDAQTVNSNYQSIQALFPGKNLSTLTTADLANLSNADQETIATALARMQHPDVARNGGNLQNPFEPVSLSEKIQDFGRQTFRGQLYSPDRVLQGIQTASNLYNQRNSTMPGSSSSTTASGAPFDYAGAKKAGYSDAAIQAYLASH